MAATERLFHSPSEEATEALAEALGAALWAGAVVALDGELGAGKTAFVRGLARGLGVAEPTSSPTYTLMHEYVGRLPVYHFDAWMTSREGAFLEDGGADWFDGTGVAVVEWAERVRAWLPEPRLAVRLEHAGPFQRDVRLEVVGPPGADRARYEALLEGLRGAGETTPDSGSFSDSN